MKLSDIPYSQLQQRLRDKGVDVFMPPYRVRLTTTLVAVMEELSQLYADYLIFENDAACDFHICLFEPNGLRRFFRRQVQFALDEFLPFKPLPFCQAHAMLEWGLNWCVGNRDQTHLIMHAGVVAIDGKALIMPAASGSGKSTLSAALSQEGFQLLSDELCLLQLDGQKVTPMTRPVSLKNQSIDLIKARYPSTVFSRTAYDTRKGTVAHMRPPQKSVQLAALGPFNQAPTPALMVIPQYVADSTMQWHSVAAEEALNFCISQIFNFSVLGETGFDALLQLLRTIPVYSLSYANLDEAIPFLRAQLEQTSVA